jgi:hypothetical protein
MVLSPWTQIQVSRRPPRRKQIQRPIQVVQQQTSGLNIVQKSGKEGTTCFVSWAFAGFGRAMLLTIGSVQSIGKT